MVAGEFVGSSKAVKRPCLPSSPAGIVPPALVGRLTHKFPRTQIKNPFMRSTAVTAHQIAPGGQTMLNRNSPQCIVLSFFGCIENQSDVHHNVDKQAFRGHKRAEIAPASLETQGERTSSINHDLLLRRVASHFAPDLPAGKEKETEIVNSPIRFAMLD